MALATERSRCAMHRHASRDGELLRKSLLAAVGLWLVEGASATLSFVWPAAARVDKRVRVGTLDDLVTRNPSIPIQDGFPVYVDAAQAFVVVVEPGGGFRPGNDATGTGAGVNVIALSKICPHLGCRPNPCLEDWWMHCPCHQSRYDRLGIKAAGEAFGPAPRSMDRFAVEVDEAGRADDQHRQADPRVAAGRPRATWPDPAACSQRMHLSVEPLLHLYPKAWRARYAEEMSTLLDESSTDLRDRLDLVAGALDAHLHPIAAPAWPIAAAAIAGLAWTFAGGVAQGQPAPLDWPGYLDETLPMLAGAVPLAALGAIGATTRLGDRNPVIARLGRTLLTLGGLAWTALLVAAVLHAAGGAPLAVAATVVAFGCLLSGIALLAVGDARPGTALLVAALVLVVPAMWSQIAFGVALVCLAASLLRDPRPAHLPPVALQ